jgi:hypothetical protein
VTLGVRAGRQIAAGAVLAATGVIAIALQVRAVAAFSYPIVWWGLLLMLDASYFRRWGESPMRSDWRQFVGVTVPLSVLFWLIYEYLNLFFPQWRYRGIFESHPIQAAIGFASFATVIPIMIELYWLFGGRGKAFVPVKRSAPALVVAGLFLLLLPLFSDWFWPNQGSWLGPALFLAPVVGVARMQAAPAALVAGFVWELINNWSLTKWEYTIHPDWPRLFEMPLLGYLGFVPFAFSTLAVYAWQRRIRPRATVVVVLWVAAAAAMYGLVLLGARWSLMAPL